MLSKLEQAKQILDESLFLLRYPDNGWYYCRWCGERRPDKCKLDCWYDQHIKVIDTYRSKVKAYLASLP